MPSQQHADPRLTGPEIPEPSLAERARTLASLGRIGSLFTHSRKFPGFPFGSMMPYAADERGLPVFFIGSMAMHTQDPRASLLITQPDVSGDPLGAARVTLIGTEAEVLAAEVRELYLSRYENAKLWQDFTDFAYYRLDVTGVYFVGGCRAYMMKNILHDWDNDRARQILLNCRRAVPEDGVLLLVEYCLGEENAPSLGKTVDMVMLAVTGGRERTVSEHGELFASAGFRMGRIIAVRNEVMILEAMPA